MAQTFPLPLTFFGGLRVAEASFHLAASLKASRTRGGAIITAQLSERLWQCQITLPTMRHREAAVVEAQLSALSESGRSLFVSAVPALGPAYDPTGALLSGSSPVIHTISADSRELKLASLPAGYTITAGDLLSFVYGSNPTRYAMHRVVVGGVANGLGITPLIEVTPPIRPGATASTAVELVNPYFKAIYIPGGASRHRPRFTDGLTLNLYQTLGP